MIHKKLLPIFARILSPVDWGLLYFVLWAFSFQARIFPWYSLKVKTISISISLVVQTLQLFFVSCLALNARAWERTVKLEFADERPTADGKEKTKGFLKVGYLSHRLPNKISCLVWGGTKHVFLSTSKFSQCYWHEILNFYTSVSPIQIQYPKKNNWFHLDSLQSFIHSAENVMRIVPIFEYKCYRLENFWPFFLHSKHAFFAMCTMLKKHHDQMTKNTLLHIHKWVSNSYQHSLMPGWLISIHHIYALAE
jgi:hypothetical protein